MENRFGLKDLIIIVLLLAILVSIWFAMVQFDRQWQDLQAIKQRLSGGVVAVQNGGANGGGNANLPYDPEYFYRLHVAREAEDFAHGDWFIDVFAQTVAKLTPLVTNDAYQTAIENYVLESLIARDPETFEWRPWIARSWDIAEDGLSITYTLREDVTFSDGRPLTSEDVVFTFDLIMNPDINNPAMKSYYENFEAVEADGPHRVIFRMKRPYFQSLNFSGGMAIMPKHFYEQFTPEQINEMPGLLMGSGPYQLAVNPREWKPGTGAVELVRNDNYWGPRPSFDKLVFREIPDQTARLTTFRNREIDRFSIPADQYPRLKDDPDLRDHAKLYVYEAPNFGYRYIGWNQRREGEPTRFADKRVRRAMTMLTNRKEMAEQLQSGLASVADGPFNHLGEQDNPDIDPLPYDPDAAKKLLAEAGYEDRDDDGVLEGPDGQDFRFKLIYPSGSSVYEQMVFYLKDAFAVAGIVLQPDPTEWNTMLQRIDERNFDAITLGWTGSIEGDPKQIFHSDSIKGGGSNYVSYRNEELDELIDTARRTLDEARRFEIWHRVHSILHEDQPYTFLFFSKAPVFLDKRIHNVQITNMGMNARTEMYVPAPLQLWSE